jgi:hypothetical protein
VLPPSWPKWSASGQPGSAELALPLLLASIHSGHHQLLSYGLRCLEAHLSRAGALPPAVAAILPSIVLAASQDTSSSSPASLQALLASRLPFDPGMSDYSHRSLVVLAALSKRNHAAKLRLLRLHRRPADRCRPALRCRQAFDTSHIMRFVVSTCSYTCPIHRALHAVVSLQCWLPLL